MYRYSWSCVFKLHNSIKARLYISLTLGKIKRRGGSELSRNRHVYRVFLYGLRFASHLLKQRKVNIFIEL